MWKKGKGRRTKCLIADNISKKNCVHFFRVLLLTGIVCCPRPQYWCILCSITDVSRLILIFLVSVQMFESNATLKLLIISFVSYFI